MVLDGQTLVYERAVVPPARRRSATHSRSQQIAERQSFRRLTGLAEERPTSVERRATSCRPESVAPVKGFS